MIVLGRHRALTQDAWNEPAVRAAIEEIATDAIAHFDPDTFWPAHPSDDGVEDGSPSLYWGAAGVIWALDYLHRIGAVNVTKDFRPVLPKLLERTITAFETFRQPIMRSMARCCSATWVPHLSRCALRPRRASPIWFMPALKQIWDCRSGS